MEYGLAEKGGIGVAALKNNAGAFVTPWQANITRMANEIALPPSAASAQWEHVNFLSLGAPGCCLRKAWTRVPLYCAGTSVVGIILKR